MIRVKTFYLFLFLNKSRDGTNGYIKELNKSNETKMGPYMGSN